jgi:hypothetical protein
MILERLTELKGGTFAGITTQTQPKMRKTNNPYVKDGVVKITEATVIIGFYYKNSVNNRLEAQGFEPNFEPEPRKWGKRIKGSPLVEHKGNYYLECLILPDKTNSVYYNAKTGEEIPYENIEQFLYKSSKPKTQNMLQDGTEVVLRDYKIENIREIRVGGETISRI